MNYSLLIPYINGAIVTDFDQHNPIKTLFLQGNVDDDDPLDYDEPSTIINVENIFMDNFFQNVSSPSLFH